MIEQEAHGVKAELNFEVVVSEEDATVYVKLSGFDDAEDANAYAEYLANTLPLMLFESEVIQ